MHIAEGFLPATHALAWTAVAAPFVALGARRLTRLAAASHGSALTIGAAGGFTLLMSALKLPSVAGSSSHPTGVALGTIACGPAAMAAIGPPVLLIQALLLAHGGLTTLGANTVSMAVAGPWAAWLVWRGSTSVLPHRAAICVATIAGSLATYLVTALQLALAFPDPSSGVWGAWLKFGSIFLVAQAPLTVAEAVFTVAALATLSSRTAQARGARRA